MPSLLDLLARVPWPESGPSALITDVVFGLTAICIAITFLVLCIAFLLTALRRLLEQWESFREAVIELRRDR
jgi:hypothetical protein